MISIVTGEAPSASSLRSESERLQIGDDQLIITYTQEGVEPTVTYHVRSLYSAFGAARQLASK